MINIRPVMTREQAIDLAVRRAAERLAAQQGTAPRRILNWVLADGAPMQMTFRRVVLGCLPLADAA